MEKHEIDEFEAMQLREFLSAYWGTFVQFCDNVESGLAKKIYSQLGGEEEE